MSRVNCVSQCFITVVPLYIYAWDFVFAAQTGGQSCRLVVAESLFVYNACVGVCAHQVGKVYALYVIHQNSFIIMDVHHLVIRQFCLCFMCYC